jgi:hypothetical protein
MRRLLWYGNSSGSDRNPNSSDNPVCLSVQSYGTYCQQGGTEGNEDPGGVQGVLNWKIAKKPVRLAMTRLLQSKPGFDNFYQDFCLDFQAIL